MSRGRFLYRSPYAKTSRGLRLSTIATTVMLASGMSDSDYAEALESFAHQEMLAAAANDPDFLERIRCAM